MNFWQKVGQGFGKPGAFVLIAAASVAVAFVLAYFRPSERKRLRSALILFVLAILGLLAAAATLAFGVPPNHWVYLSLHGASLFMFAAAIVNVGAIFLFAVALRSIRLEPPHIAQDLLVALVYIAIAITLLSHSGVDLRGVVATSAIITAVIAFSLQDSLGNVMGGTMLQLERVIGVGDWIRVDELEGKVKEIRWRQTSIETRNWDTVLIPNSVLAKAKVSVIGRRTGEPVQHRQWVYFQVSLNHPPTQVIETVETALQAEEISAVATEPKPHCLLTDMKSGDGYYAVRYWLTDLSRTDPTDSLVRIRIFAALQRARIALAVPMQSILINEEKSHREQAETAELQQRLEAVKKSDLFHSLTDDEQNELASQLVTAPFVRGEALTRQGAQAHWLYIIREGEAEVRVTIDSASQKVGTLRGGDYFGEMGLMTGEPRTSTVLATTDVKCYRLGREAFQAIVRRRPEIAEAISLTLAHRRVGLDTAREEATEEAMREKMQNAQGALLRRIRNFLALTAED
ncbi:MAG TPA: mechanosensitive ion channel family protein [Chthoniobacterales bacterium]|jgi:small-conductance mechanosensitive channel